MFQWRNHNETELPEFMKSIRIAIVICATALNLHSAFAAGEGWTHDFEAAKKQAAAEKKDLLLDFTGSDWCAPCGMLEKEVFSQAAFKTPAMEKFVLVELDFPQDKSKMMAETVKQNNDLQAKYLPSGYPTVILCSADGKPYAANSGYVDGGPEKFLALLESLRGNKAKIEEGLAAAAKLDGKAKAQAIIDALKGSGIPAGSFGSFYKEQMDQVKAADPNDEIGFFKSANTEQKFNELQGKLSEMLLASKNKEMIEMIDAEITKFEGEQKQALHLLKAMACQQTYKFDDALKSLDEVEKIGGGEEVKSGVAMMRAQVESAKAGFEEQMKKMQEGK